MKKNIVFLLLTALAITLSSCSGEKKPSDTSSTLESNSTSDSTESGGKKEEINLVMIESLTSPARTELLRKTLDKYEEANPNVKIELISPPLANADDKISQMLSAEQQIDILEVRDQTVTQFVNNKKIEDMEKYIEKWADYDSLNNSAKDSIKKLAGGSYLIPYGFYQRVLFYNKKNFEEAGLKVPTTYEELLDVSKKMTDPTKNKYGYSFRGGKGGVWYADMQIQSYVGDVNVDSAYFKSDGSTIFSDPKALEALEDYKKLYEEGSPKDSLNWSFAEMVEGFVSGTTSILIQDPEVIMSCKEKMPEGTWGTAPLPVGTSGKVFSPKGFSGWGMTSYSKNKDEAWKVIEFLSNYENNTYFCTQNSLLPIHEEALAKDPFFSTEYYKAFGEMESKSDVYVSAISPQDFKGWGPFMKTADEGLQKYLTGMVTAEELLKEWDDYWLKQLEEKNK